MKSNYSNSLNVANANLFNPFSSALSWFGLEVNPEGANVVILVELIFFRFLYNKLEFYDLKQIFCF